MRYSHRSLLTSPCKALRDYLKNASVVLLLVLYGKLSARLSLLFGVFQLFNEIPEKINELIHNPNALNFEIT